MEQRLKELPHVAGSAICVAFLTALTIKLLVSGLGLTEIIAYAVISLAGLILLKTWPRESKES